MDGVLVDNRDAHVEAFREFCRRNGIELAEDKLMEIFGRGNDEIIPALFDRGLVESRGVQSLASEKEAVYREIYASSIEPVKGLTTFLEGLKTAGYKIAVGSSGCSENVGFVLEKCDIVGCFDAIVNGEMVTHCKPDPEIFLLAARLLGITPDECLVFEDSFSGIEAACRAGMQVVAVATTFTRAELTARIPGITVIDDFTQVAPEYLAAIGR